MQVQDLSQASQLIVSANKEVIATALARVLGVSPSEPVDLHYSPGFGGYRSYRIFSKDSFLNSTPLVGMSCTDLAKELLRISKTNEVHYFPPENPSFEKGWVIMGANLLGQKPMAIAAAEWFGGQDG